MDRKFDVWGACALCLFIVGCAEVPQLPSDEHLPLKTISMQAVCDIRSTFVDLAPGGALETGGTNREDARLEQGQIPLDKFAIGIAITPKSTNDFSLSVAASATNNPKSVARNLPLWTVAFAPSGSAAAIEREGDVTGTISYTLHSALFYIPDPHIPNNAKPPIKLIPNPVLADICSKNQEEMPGIDIAGFSVLSTEMGGGLTDDGGTAPKTNFERWFHRVLEPIQDNVLILIGGSEIAAQEREAMKNRTIRLNAEKARQALHDRNADLDVANAQLDAAKLRSNSPAGTGGVDAFEIASEIAKVASAKNLVEAATTRLASAEAKPAADPATAKVGPFSYTTHLVVTWDGGASATWSAPGAALHFMGIGPTVTNKYSEDVQVAVSLVPDTGDPVHPGQPSGIAMDILRSQLEILQLPQIFRPAGE